MVTAAHCGTPFQVRVGTTNRSGNGDSRCATGASIYVDVPAFASWIAANAR